MGMFAKGFLLLSVVLVHTVALSPALAEEKPCAPLSAGLVGWWQAEENANDQTGQHNGTPWNVAFVHGFVGGAFQFDGAGSRVNVADGPAFELTNSLTIEGWLNINTFLGAQIFFRGDSRPGLDPYYLSAEPGNRVAFVIMNEQNQLEVLYASVSPNTWTHVAAVLDGDSGTMKIYVDGAIAAQTTTAIRPFAKLDPNADPGIGIGNHAGTLHNFPFNGLVDEIALFGRPLTAGDIRAIYDAGAAGKCVSVNSCTIDTLVAQVETSALHRSRQRPLLVALQAARFALERESPHTAVNLLRAFQHKVASQLANTDPALADSLITCADEIIQSLKD